MLSLPKKDLVSLQWEKSFTLAQNTNRYYWFGINRLNAGDILAIPCIPDCFNKFILLYKESNVAQYKQYVFYFPDGTLQSYNIVPDTLILKYLSSRNLRLFFRAKLDEATDFDIMLKFLKA